MSLCDNTIHTPVRVSWGRLSSKDWRDEGDDSLR